MTAAASLPARYGEINRYTGIIVDEALRRGIAVEIVDPDLGELALTGAGRTVRTIQSLSELTSAVAFRRCDHKPHTRRVLAAAGLHVPAGRLATHDDADVAFLREHGELVVKPARGEQGWGICVGVTDAEQLARAIDAACAVCPEVLLEERVHGEDLRIIVIGGEVVAASVRRPPTVAGDGARTIAELVTALDAERAAATDGAARIPLDETTTDVVAGAGYGLDDVLPAGERLAVRLTANVHTGGTITDVTDDIHPSLGEVAIAAATAIDIPVLGLDLMVPDLAGPDYAVIEANEQPGLANHEPRPTAERFVDLLFPETVA